MQSAGPLNQLLTDVVLTMRATVWARTDGVGPYNTAVKTDLACYLGTVSRQLAATSSQRAELAGLRTFMWDTEYDLPEQGVQIEVTSPAHYAGQRWNPVAGTRSPAILPGFDGPIAIEVDVRRAS